MSMRKELFDIVERQVVKVMISSDLMEISPQIPPKGTGIEDCVGLKGPIAPTIPNALDTTRRAANI
ncbi:hypothetical protein PABG_02658 [Paracoccidioides brasiliensis Pb03]|uniref:Uncharacterized protein n=1 Tax=Paracoccidioides brasiliensis (strain Pb18) TaxID=502780 RepID=C1FZ73_PARBD|nr:uncharacterized protein PADG_01099 [Paracoccidioides brasiliensis Pb18]EEH20399.2 hypothetical protein PABG_02658 [Paracoccidioides brasiliensis Pb03]EEH44810.1 hypothetical protein PADG_01099 [Paracoccidioides brasiliensis Pb18]ODH47544.1 hypothetical protein GX48_06350 [Paracoccidioides brasiliensis]